MTPKFIQIVTGPHHIFGLCADGSVWKKSFVSDSQSPWERFGS